LLAIQACLRPGRAPAFQIMTASDGLRFEHSPPRSRHPLSNSAEATSMVSLCRVAENSNEGGSGQAGKSTRQYPSGMALDPAIAFRAGKIMQIAPSQRSRTLRADRGPARRHVAHHHKLQFVGGHLTGPCLPAYQLRRHRSRLVIDSSPRTPFCMHRRVRRSSPEDKPLSHPHWG
jgi:hypothetical protein